MAENKVLALLEKVVNHEGTDKEYTEEEKIRAAYALNMCMVSVSQIIDYDDLYILEQEYEQILNNLNLEMMPKDEALLKIIKQLLDTITFFRIQEGDKIMIEKEYQQQMKNAIWNAVPNFGLIVAGGNPVTMAISLVSQVGIGYMNYRRAKSENEIEYEKKKWQLQRSAIEQFNGLRRELFDTAWRLADTYRFPDEYRLTERQIKQYNNILMDPDEIRKYERLTSIKDTCVAYPPFWYHYGSTANHIARNPNLAISDEARMDYKKRAVEHFEQYWKSNQNGLLRDDQLASACALEHIDLLDVEKDADRIADLLDKAVKYSGKSNDILQLCGIAYLRIGKKDEAIKLFRLLVNEEYNTTVNAQLLSGLYVNKALHDGDNKARSDYEILTTRVNPSYLLRLPPKGKEVSENELNDEFCEKQEGLLQAKYDIVIKYLLDDLSLRLNKLIPTPNADERYPESYFSNEEIKHRINDLKELFESSFKKSKKEEYLVRLIQSEFVDSYFNELNSFFDRVSALNGIRDRDALQEIIENYLIEQGPTIAEISKRIDEKKVSFEDMCKLLMLTSGNVYILFATELSRQAHTTILGMSEMSKYAIAEKALIDYCHDNNIPEPELIMSTDVDTYADATHVKTYFSYDLLGKYGKELRKERQRYRKIEEIIRKHNDQIGTINEKGKIYFHDSPEFVSYFENSKLNKQKDTLIKTIAVYDDNSIQNFDMFFTTEGIVPVIHSRVGQIIPYFSLTEEDIRKKAADTSKKIGPSAVCLATSLVSPILGFAGLASLAISGGIAAADVITLRKKVEEIRPVFNDICEALIAEANGDS